MKIDLAKKYKSYYTAKAKPELINLEEITYLSIEGQGDPSDAEYAEKLSTLYPVAYTLKFMYKAEERDFAVAKLEGQWWFDETKYAAVSMEDTPTKIPRKEWFYRMLIRMPEFVNEQQVNNAIEKVVSKKNLESAREVKLFTIKPTKAVQMLHVGPFDKEPETLQIIMDFCKENKLSRNGLHQEVYLSDFRKTAPEKLKTILREPVK